MKRWAPLLWSLTFLAVAALAFVPDWLHEGSSLRFESPVWLWALALVPLVWVTAYLEKRFTGRFRHPLLAQIVAEGSGFKTKLLPVSVGVKTLGLTLLIVAIARPQDASRREETEMEGIDIVVTMDVSLSMQAGDLRPTRLGASKEVVLEFIQRRKNDRLGAVIFAENAYTLCPLTLDYSVLSQMIADLELGVISGNATAIGNAVGVSINRLRSSDAKSKTIILLTDGTSNAGNISPEQATEFARTMGIRIYTVLMGQKDDAPVAQGMGFFKQQIFGRQNVPINQELLVKMSEETGGAFFEATDRKGLESSFHSILDDLERSKIADQGVVYAEVFGRYLWPGLILLLLDLLTGLFVLRRMP